MWSCSFSSSMRSDVLLVQGLTGTSATLSIHPSIHGCLLDYLSVRKPAYLFIFCIHLSLILRCITGFAILSL